MVLSFTGEIPVGAEKIPQNTFSYMTNTTSFSNGRNLRYFRGGKCDIIRFTTTDPEAKLVFLNGLPGNPGSSSIVINLAPGTYTFLRCLVAYNHVFIEHNEWAGADYTIETFDLDRKVRKALMHLSTNNPIFTTIAGGSYAYYGGYLIRGVDAPVQEINITPPQRVVNMVHKCKACHQDLPGQKIMSYERKDRVAFAERFNNMFRDGLLKM